MVLWDHLGSLSQKGSQNYFQNGFNLTLVTSWDTLHYWLTHYSPKILICWYDIACQRTLPRLLPPDIQKNQFIVRGSFAWFKEAIRCEKVLSNDFCVGNQTCAGASDHTGHWKTRFIEAGGLRYLFNVFTSGRLQRHTDTDEAKEAESSGGGEDSSQDEDEEERTSGTVTGGSAPWCEWKQECLSALLKLLVQVYPLTQLLSLCIFVRNHWFAWRSSR